MQNEEVVVLWPRTRVATIMNNKWVPEDITLEEESDLFRCLALILIRRVREVLVACRKK